MASKTKQKQLISNTDFRNFILTILAFGLILNYADFLGKLILPLLFFCTFYCAYLIIKRNKRISEETKLFKKISNSVKQHESALISYYHQSRREDNFGNVDEKSWFGWIDKFLENQVRPNCEDFKSWKESSVGQKAVRAVNNATIQMVENNRSRNPLSSVNAAELSPLDYEYYCAELLKSIGWKVQMTTATRDGGADFIAEKENWRIVVQCKRYAKPVGNDAIQQVTSAKMLYNGNLACVVAPQGFTKQAQREAFAQEVQLLHHSALPALAEKLAA
jgi:restriction system protein